MFGLADALNVKMTEFQVIFLAAGYGTRLAADLESIHFEKWKILKNCPKPLLELNGVPLLSRWLDILSTEADRIREGVRKTRPRCSTVANCCFFWVSMLLENF